MYFRTKGIILSQKNFSEADKILIIYTQNAGKISCLAKGVRRPLSKKAGHIELGNICKFFVAKGKNIDLLTEATVENAFGSQNQSVSQANKIYHLLEVVDNLTPTNQKNTRVYNLLASFLKNIDREDNFNLISVIFKIKLLTILGYFSTNNLKESTTKDLLEDFEKKEVHDLVKSVNLKAENYLKLLSFLDSMIEKQAERKLKTNKFLNGQF